MEASEPDALAEAAPEEGDPFEGVAPDGGPDPDLVTPGELGGTNTPDPLAEEPEQDELPAEPEPTPDPEPIPEPEEAEPTPDPEPEPEPEPIPDTEPEPTPETKRDPEREKAAAEAEAKKDAEAKAEKAKKGKKKKAPATPAKKGERAYVVVQCDKDDKPIAIAGEVKTRTDKDARRVVFEGMDDTEAHLTAVPARYWNVKTLRAKTREVKDIEED